MKNFDKIDGFLYQRVTLLIWRTTGPSRIGNIDIDAGIMLTKILDEWVELPIVLDFKGVLAMTDGALSSFFKKLFTFKREVHFINHEYIKRVIRNLYDEFNRNQKLKYVEKDGKICINYSRRILNKSKKAIEEKVNEQFKLKTQDLVKNCFIPNKRKQLEPLRSTPILASGQYDASKLISDPNTFSFLSILLADKVNQLIIEQKIHNPELLSVSLRSSPFANAVSVLLDIEMKTVDHLGPYQKIWEVNSLNELYYPNTNFIFIGDFIVGGTELKLANLFAKYCYSNLDYAVVIGNVLNVDRYIGYKVQSLISLNRIHTDCKYALFKE